VAAAAAACQGIWLNRLIADMLGTKEMTVKLLMDNMSAIAPSKNPVHHDRSKHIDTRYHFLRECIEEGKWKLIMLALKNSSPISSLKLWDESSSWSNGVL